MWSAAPASGSFTSAGTGAPREPSSAAATPRSHEATPPSPAASRHDAASDALARSSTTSTGAPRSKSVEGKVAWLSTALEAAWRSHVLTPPRGAAARFHDSRSARATRTRTI